MIDLKKATPGPWTVTQTLLGGGSDVNRRVICSSIPPFREIATINYHMHKWTEEDEANLQLILSSVNSYSEEI